MRNHGFTLIELLITLALVVILATVAVPGFQRVIATNRISADHNEILAGLNFARSEAVKRRKNIIFSITNESPWRYEVFPESDANDVLRSRSASDDRTSVTVGSVEFNPLGRRAECVGWNQCAFAVNWAGGERFSGIEVGLTGRVSKIDTLPDPDA